MRWNATALFIFVLLIFKFSALEAQFSTVLEGKVSPAEERRERNITIEYQEQYLLYKPIRQLVRTEKDGSFELTIPLKKPTWVRWQSEGLQGELYLHVGDSLHMQISAKANSYQVKFSGLGAAENNFLQSWHRSYGFLSDRKLYPQKYKSLSAKGFKEEASRLRKNQLRLLEEAVGKEPLSDDFVLAIEQRIDYEWANHLSQYPVLHAHLNNIAPRLPQNNYYSFFEEVIIQAPSALRQPSYLLFLKNYLEFRYTRSRGQNSLKAPASLYYQRLWKITEEELKNSVQAHAQALLVVDALQKRQHRIAQKLYQSYLQAHSNQEPTSWLKDFIEQNQKIKIGQLAPDFLLQDAKGNNVRLQDFEGSVVYLFFNTAQDKNIPIYLDGMSFVQNQLRQNNNNQQVAFIWIQVNQLEVMQPEGWDTDRQNAINLKLVAAYFQESLKYDISTLPIAYLIDKKSTIAFEKAKLPSDKGLTMDIASLLD